MSKLMLAYIERQSPVHILSGTTKLAVFILWSILTMAGYDTRVMFVMAILGFMCFAFSHIKICEVSFILKMLVVFMIVNLVTIYLFAPEQGSIIYGTRHLIIKGYGRWTLSAEQLFYEFNILLKYLLLVPVAITLVVTTNPSEFAASLNRVGVPYTITYAVSLALRYIPDIQRDWETISQAQQARGVELSKKAPPLKKLRAAFAILLPLIFSSIERIDTISCAMELRSFGKHKRRTWYASRPFAKMDFVVLILAVILFCIGIWITFKNGSRFYNPFT
ncbi:MAG: energy-coupling factor transporter transmembrane protein EcfT [Spirochaetaceae bacterium]|nr:energy-coupling factor transporter transmembrane protein EcfT [Spirochaetaceae bacterium]